MTGDRRSFQVDLRGMVDLLSQHLYSGPEVYLRELLQNSLDAITARRALDPGAPGRITLIPADVADDGCLHVVDTGIGLGRSDIDQVLATIGASSKRDDVGFAREEFLGQFGIGLLSCLLVTDEVRLRTRGPDGASWEWAGRVDGSYQVRPAPEPLPEQGTEVVLPPRPHHDRLLRADAVTRLADDYGRYLPVQIRVAGAGGAADDAPTRIGEPGGFPWERAELSPAERREQAVAMAQELLGVSPMDVVELSDPASGVRGYAYVLPTGGGERSAHRVYLRHMLVNRAGHGLLPDWAFFVRAVVNADRLRVTASREDLHHDDLLAETRERLGDQLKRWLVRMLSTDQARAERFLAVHHLGIKAVAARDDEMVELVGSQLPFETTAGRITLQELSELSRVVNYVDRTDDFQQLVPLAHAADRPVLNAGYAYDTAILHRWLARHPELEGRQVSPRELAADFAQLPPAEAAEYAGLLDVARTALGGARCLPGVRTFQPASLPAVLLTDRASVRELDREDVAEAAEGAWAAALEVIATPDVQPAFVLNAANPVVQRLARSEDTQVQTLALRALYAQVLLSGQHRLRAAEAALVGTALPALIDRALGGSP